MSNPLSKQEYRELQEALLDAFRSSADLRQLVRFALNENLEAIAGNGKLTEVVSNLIEWVEARNRTDELINGAHEENSGNPKLAAFVAKWQSRASTPGTSSSGPKNPDPVVAKKLTDELIFEIHDAAITAGLTASRDVLVAASVIGQIPTVNSPSAQLLRDLQWMNDAGRLLDNSFPLLKWLDTALRLTTLRPESKVFEKARKTLVP